MSIRTLVCGVSLATMAAMAHAEDFNSTVTLVPNPSTAGQFSAGWGVTHVEAGAFTDTFTFTPDTAGGFVASSLASIGFLSATNLDFTSITLNGVPFELGSTGEVEVATFGPMSLQGPLTLVVMGIAGPKLPDGAAVTASYGATIGISPVPELETWALMLGGLAAVGSIAQRRRQRDESSL